MKGKSPAASLINRRTGAAAGRVSADGAASLGRKVRPKSANISPVRHSRDLVSPPTLGGRASAGILDKTNIHINKQAKKSAYCLANRGGHSC